MERRLFGIVLVAAVVLAEDQAEVHYQKQYVPEHGQAFSYSHVIHDHGPSLPHHVGHGHNHHAVKTINKPVPYPVLQPYAITVEQHIPYAVSIPVAVPVPKPYPVTVPKPYPVPVERPVPVTVPKPYPYPVKYPVSVAVPTLVPFAVPKPYPVLVQDHHDYHEDDASAEYSSSSETDENR